MENNFDKNIRDAMNNPPDVPFEDRLWQDMNSQLNQVEEKPKRSMLIGWMPAALFSIIPFVLAGFFWQKHDQALEKINRLETLLNEHKSDADNISKKTVILYDTIYNKVVLNEIKDTHRAKVSSGLSELSFQNNQNAHSETFLNTLTGITFFEDSKYAKGLDFYKNNKDEILNEIRKNLAATASKEMTAERVPGDMPFLPLLENYLNLENHIGELPAVLSKKQKHQKSAKYYLLKAKPSRFAFAGSIGNAYDWDFAENTIGLTTHLQTEIGYGQNWGLVIGVNYLPSKFEIEITEEQNVQDLMSTLPKLGNEPIDDLEEVYGYFNYLQVPFGLKYNFRPNQKIQPTLSGGLLTRMATKSSLRYEYDDFENVLGDNLLSSNLSLKAYWSSFGLQLQPTENWGVFVETGLQFDLEKGIFKYENRRNIQWNAGIRYHLK